MVKKESNSDILNKLFEDYGLVYDKEDKKNSDIFVNKNFKIITRTGVEKIQAKLSIDVKYKIHKLKRDWCVIKAKGVLLNSDGSKAKMQTFGEASLDYNKILIEKQSKREEKDGNVVDRSIEEGVIHKLISGNVGQNPPYVVAMAEKRAKARCVLQLAGLYAHGVYSEDESDEFSKEVRNARR